MRAEELDSLTEKELQDKANACFIVAENSSIYVQGGEAERLRLQLEAQYYLTLVARKRDERVARRDFWMEVAVIVLIGLEIILSFIFGWYGLKEGQQQAKLLEHMDQSAAATANTLSDLQKAQERSAGTLAQMNDSIGQQAKTTQSMNRVLQRQLAILSGEQKARLDEAKLHPDLRVAVAQNGTPSLVMLHANSTTGDKVYPLGKGQIGANPPGRIGLAFYLLNVGNTPLKRPRIAARVGLPNTFICLEGPTSSVWLTTGEVPNSERRYCNPGESVIDTMVDIQPTPDAKPETGGTLVRLVYDEAPGAT
jgi:hypothetical protein